MHIVLFASFIHTKQVWKEKSLRHRK
jgi:hypothetical protein